MTCHEPQARACMAMLRWLDMVSRVEEEGKANVGPGWERIIPGEWAWLGCNGSQVLRSENGGCAARLWINESGNARERGRGTPSCTVEK
ncbi:hypothetical protein IF2G_01040 [Cordyceps javanica]|nr:hypothetical protein IF2G_01040 [Cordyceps javanica]